MLSAKSYFCRIGRLFLLLFVTLPLGAMRHEKEVSAVPATTLFSHRLIEIAGCSFEPTAELFNDIFTLARLNKEHHHYALDQETWTTHLWQLLVDYYGKPILKRVALSSLGQHDPLRLALNKYLNPAGEIPHPFPNPFLNAAKQGDESFKGDKHVLDKMDSVTRRFWDWLHNRQPIEVFLYEFYWEATHRQWASHLSFLWTTNQLSPEVLKLLVRKIHRIKHRGVMQCFNDFFHTIATEYNIAALANETPLISAVRRGSSDEVRKELAADCSAMKQDSLEMSALMSAAASNRSETVEPLLKQLKKRKEPEKNDELTGEIGRALEQALRNRSDQVLPMLIKEVKELKDTAKYQIKWFVEAGAQGGRVSLLQKLNDAFPTMPTSKSLVIAAAYGHLNAVKFLSSLRESKPKHRGAALLAATEKGHADIVKFLIEGLKTDVNHADQHGQTALIVALRKKRFDLAWFLIKQGADANHRAQGTQERPMVCAIRAHHKPIVDFFIKEGIDIVCWEDANPPLIAALQLSWMPLAKLIIERGIAQFPQDDFINKPYGPNKNTVLSTAASEGFDSATIRFLLEQGADKEKIEDDEHQPFVAAMWELQQAPRFNYSEDRVANLVESVLLLAPEKRTQKEKKRIAQW